MFTAASPRTQDQCIVLRCHRGDDVTRRQAFFSSIILRDKRCHMPGPSWPKYHYAAHDSMLPTELTSPPWLHGKMDRYNRKLAHGKTPLEAWADFLKIENNDNTGKELSAGPALEISNKNGFMYHCMNGYTHESIYTNQLSQSAQLSQDTLQSANWNGLSPYYTHTQQRTWANGYQGFNRTWLWEGIATESFPLLCLALHANTFP